MTKISRAELTISRSLRALESARRCVRSSRRRTIAIDGERSRDLKDREGSLCFCRCERPAIAMATNRSPGSTGSAPRLTIAFAQQQSSDLPQGDDCCGTFAIACSPSIRSPLAVRSGRLAGVTASGVYVRLVSPDPLVVGV